MIFPYTPVHNITRNDSSPKPLTIHKSNKTQYNNPNKNNSKIFTNVQ